MTWTRAANEHPSYDFAEPVQRVLLWCDVELMIPLGVCLLSLAWDSASFLVGSIDYRRRRPRVDLRPDKRRATFCGCAPSSGYSYRVVLLRRRCLPAHVECCIREGK